MSNRKKVAVEVVAILILASLVISQKGLIKTTLELGSEARISEEINILENERLRIENEVSRLHSQSSTEMSIEISDLMDELKSVEKQLLKLEISSAK